MKATRADAGRLDIRHLLLAAATLGLIALAYLVHQVAHVFLLLFAACLFALLLDGGARLVRRGLGLPRGWALTVCCLSVLVILGGLGWFAGERIGSQMDQLGERLPDAWRQLRDWIMQFSWVRAMTDDIPANDGTVDKEMVSGVAAALKTVLGAAGTVGIIVFAGLYLAATPALYERALLALLPPAQRGRGQEIFTRLGQALRRWLVGRLLSMVFVGLLTGLMLWGVGLPLPLPLGLIAGVFSFVPYLGPILGAIPGLLIAFSEGMDMALIVAGGYWLVQVFEGFLITPLIERKAVRIPPAYQIVGQLVFGSLAGVLGVLLASPILVAAAVVVQILYLRDRLGEHPDVIGATDDSRPLDASGAPATTSGP